MRIYKQYVRFSLSAAQIVSVSNSPKLSRCGMCRSFLSKLSTNFSTQVPPLETSSHLRLLKMPSLSPTMKSGTVRKLYLKEGASVSPYDLGLEISTLGLTKTEKDEESIMEIEIIEDMHVAMVFCKEGDVLQVDSPVAVLCDVLQDVDAVKGQLQSKALLLKNIYPAMWQAYTKSVNDSGNCGC